MAMFTEQPVLIIILGVILVAGSLLALLQTGLVKYVYVAGAMVLLTALLLVVERSVVTPKEEIRLKLSDIARVMETNDIPQILNFVSDTVPQLKSSAEKSLKRIKIERVAIKNNLEVEFTPANNPTKAMASFNAVLVVSDRRGTLNNQLSPNFFEVTFVKEAGEWRVLDYERHEPQQGMKRR